MLKRADPGEERASHSTMSKAHKAAIFVLPTPAITDRREREGRCRRKWNRQAMNAIAKVTVRMPAMVKGAVQAAFNPGSVPDPLHPGVMYRRVLMPPPVLQKASCVSLHPAHRQEAEAVRPDAGLQKSAKAKAA